jgi:hypothetical protein
MRAPHRGAGRQGGLKGRHTEYPSHAPLALTPSVDLPKGAYRVTITTGVPDMANPANALVQKEWTFTVRK